MHIKVDGLDVEVAPGTAVKEAALAAGIKIPGLCDHTDLEPYGGCRLCLVEIEGIRGFPSSCTTPASEGMVVRTNAPALQELRKSILEMLLSDHPSICINCERAGRCDDIRKSLRKVPQTMGCRYCPKDQRCELQETIKAVGLTKATLPAIGLSREVVREPFMDRDPNLCVLCGRCVRACESRGKEAISFLFRGLEAGIGTALEKTLEEVGCRFCGACVDVCPTGALLERGNKWAGLPDQVVVTTCPYCNAGCSIGLEVKEGKMLRVKPENDRLCARGRFGLDFVRDQGRLERPMIRRNGKLVEVDWETALDAAASGLSGSGYRDCKIGPGNDVGNDIGHGMGRGSGREFAALASGCLTNEALLEVKKLSQDVMKSDNLFARDSEECLGLPEEIDAYETVLLVGDISDSCPAVELTLRDGNDQKLVVICSMKSALSSVASVWLRPHPGQEAEVIDAITKKMLSGADDKCPDEGLLECGVRPGEVLEAARALSGKRSLVIVAPDIHDAHDRAPGIGYAASRLAHGDLDARSRYARIGQRCNSQGASDMGFLLFEGLPQGIKTLYIAGDNPVRAMPEMAEKLSELDYLVVQDLFLTETAALADVVLPAASFAEVDGTFTGSGGRMLPVRKAVIPKGRPDWEITAELARRISSCDLDLAGGTPISVETEGRESDHTEIKPLKQQLPVEDEDFPFTLIEGTCLYDFGCGTRTSKAPDMRYLNRERRVEVSPEDSRALGLSTGRAVLVESEWDSLLAVVQVSRRVPEGVLRMNRCQEVRQISKGEPMVRVRLKLEG